MKPQIETQQFNAFVDGELDLASQLEMEERMRLDADLRERVEALRQLRAAIREGADYHAAPAELRKRLRSATFDSEASPITSAQPAVFVCHLRKAVGLPCDLKNRCRRMK